MKQNLNRLSVEALGKLFPIIISEYDPEWKNLFFSEKQIVKKAIGSNKILSIGHIGSTAVPGLCAKPTIDILVEIKDETDTVQLIKNLKLIGYHFIPKPENPTPHMMFAKGYSHEGLTGQTFHIHIRYCGDWDEIAFRDYLIRNPRVTEEYAVLKRRLSIEFRNDREKYTDAKSSFIKEIVRRARKELKNKLEIKH